MKRIDIILELALVFSLVLILLMRTTERVEAPAPTVTLTPTFTPSPEPTPTPVPTFTPTPTSSPTPTPIPSVEKDVEPGHEFKPYTGFWAYDAKGTAQHSLQMVARSDERTGIRIVTDPLGVDRFCVALGAAWAGGHPEHIGRCVDVVMINGAVLPCVLADVKQQEHTKGRKNRYGHINNDVLEFIVEEKYLPAKVNVLKGGNGDMSKVGPEFEGGVSKMIVYDLWIENFGK